MPTYSYCCAKGHAFDIYATVANHTPMQECPTCGSFADQVITAPVMVKCAQDVCYDSPIDGKPITSHAQRIEDLKRHDCIPYDPGMKQDYERRMQASDEALDKSIDTHVEQAIEKMPTQKRGKLYNELTRQGVDAVTERITPTLK